jgi:ElaB/YqjD/DUF883 family membrane-anchored ribosome-binding protein
MHENGREQLDDTARKAQERLNRILEKVKAKGKVLLNEGLVNAKALFEEKAQTVKAKASELSDKSVGEITDDVKGYIRRNPLKSVGIAVGCGLLLGMIMRPSSRSND